MGTIKILGFDEDGNAQRLKIRIARFLDYDPVTASDKSNIRSTLGITSQGGLGDLLAANNLDDVASLDTTKANLEIPDVGTGPSQVPLNQHLGTMAYQDIAGVSVAELQGDNIGLNASPTDARLTITDSTNDCIHLTADESTIQGPYADTQIRMGGNIVVKGVNNAFLTTGSNAGLAVDSSGRVGIGTASPIGRLTVQVAADKNLVTSTQYSGASLEAVNDAYSANIPLAIYGSPIRLLSGNVEVNSGNIVMGSSYGIDFGSGASTTLDDYEEGTWSPYFAPTTGSFTALTMDVIHARYVKVGSLVHLEAYIRTDNVDTTGASGNLKIMGLPFTVANYTAVNVGFAQSWTTAPSEGYASADSIYLCERTSLNGNSDLTQVSDMTNGASTDVNRVIFTVSYYTAA